MLSNLTIRHKLLGIAIGALVTMLVVGSCSYYFVSNIQHINSLNSILSDFDSHVLELSRVEKEFELNDMTNSDFFETGTCSSVKDFGVYHNYCVEDLRSLMLNKDVKQQDLLQKIEDINKNLRKYSQTFLELQTVVREKGYSSYGLEGRLRDASDRIESLILDYSNPLLHKEMVLTLKGYEKNFLVRKEMRFHKKFVRLIEAYRGSVAIGDSSLGITESQRAILLAAIDTYREVFETIVGRDQIIGLTQDDGLVGELKRSYAGIRDDAKQLADGIKHGNARAVWLNYFFFFLFIVFLSVVVTSLLIGIYRSVVYPLQNLRKYLSELMLGILPKDINLKGNAEFAEMSLSLNSFVLNLKNKADFAIEIGKGGLTTDYKPLSEFDILGNSLVEMKERLLIAEKERIESEVDGQKLNWSNKGLAVFGEILRGNSGNIPEFATEVIEQLVNYVSANQGGIFIVESEGDQQFLSLVSSYAYDRRKYQNKKLSLGDGLIGSCAIERQIIYLSNLPDNYIEITSGLGDAPPKVLLIVPMLVENQLMGVLELASFNEFDEYVVNFVDKVAQNIASSLRSAKISAETDLLLQRFQFQSQEMAAQEQEMRRNIEDLNLIQQEIASKEMASQSFVNSINSMQARVDFSLDGIIINVNEFFTNLMHFPREDVFGNHFSMFFYDENLEDFTELWKTMLDTGLNFTHVSQYRARKKSVWLNSTFSILTDSSGLRVGVLMLSSDVSSLKKQEAELFKRQSELDLKILELKDERNLLSSQLIDAGKSVNNLNNEKKQLRDTIADLNHKLLLQNQEVTKVREEEELLKLKNKRVSFNEIENRRKLEEGVKRIQELENKSMQMAHQYKYYESTFELMPYPVVITNTDQEIIFVNTFALILFQKEAIDVVGHHCSIWGSEACKGDSCGIRQLKKGNVNSSVVWNKNSYRLRTYNLTDEQGSLIGFVEIIEDISYINWLESTLENERNLFSEVLDTVPDNVAFKDMGDHFLRINESMASFLNLGTVKEALNMLESDFVGIELINESEAGSILQAQGSLLNKLQRVNLHGGGYKWLMVTKKYLEVSIDGHPGFLEVSSDVTHFMTKIEILQKIENQKNLKIDELQSQLEIVNQDSIEKDQLIKKLQAEINKLKS